MVDLSGFKLLEWGIHYFAVAAFKVQARRNSGPCLVEDRFRRPGDFGVTVNP